MGVGAGKGRPAVDACPRAQTPTMLAGAPADGGVMRICGKGERARERPLEGAVATDKWWW